MILYYDKHNDEKSSEMLTSRNFRRYEKIGGKYENN